MSSRPNAKPASGEERVAGTQTIGRALAILGLLREAKGGLALTEVSRSLSLHLSTTHRILRALVNAGYVTQNAEERYRLGREAYLLGQAAQRELGFDNVKNYDGSWTEWGNSVGVPIEKGEAKQF